MCALLTDSLSFCLRIEWASVLLVPIAQALAQLWTLVRVLMDAYRIIPRPPISRLLPSSFALSLTRSLQRESGENIM